MMDTISLHAGQKHAHWHRNSPILALSMDEVVYSSKGTRRNDSGAQRMGTYLDCVGAGAAADPGGGGRRAMPLPCGTGQGMFPETPAGGSFWPRKDHSKRTYFDLKSAFWYPESFRRQGIIQLPKKPFYIKK